MPRLGRSLLSLGFAALGLASAASAGAAGFSTFDPAVKAMGLGGAFTAVANDPSAGYYNPGGLVLMKKAATVGLGVVGLNESQYQGLGPGVGAGTAGEQESGMSLPAHAFTALPLSPKIKLGVGIYTPFAFQTRWDNADNFSGRFLTHEAALNSFDVNTNLAFQVSPSFGIGVGAIYRTSKLTYGRHQSVSTSPTQTFDVASLLTSTDYSNGIGWDAGFLHKIGERFAWGVSYRSPIEIEHTGAGSLTQILTGNTQVDALARASLPFDVDLPTLTTFTFPDTASFGVALGLTEKLQLTTDVVRTGWSEFEGISVSLPTQPILSSTPVLGPWEDAFAYRVGLQWKGPKGIQLRGGYALEESPVPDEFVSPFLPDAQRSIVSFGFGRDWLDLAFQYVQMEDRIVRTSANDFNGAWSGNGWRFGLSVTM